MNLLFVSDSSIIQFAWMILLLFEVNYSKANEYFELSANNNNSIVLFCLGDFYLKDMTLKNCFGVYQCFSFINIYIKLSSLAGFFSRKNYFLDDLLIFKYAFLSLLISFKKILSIYKN